MNIIGDVYLLRMEWAYIKSLILKYNLKLYTVSLMYLVMIMVLVPSNNKVTYEVESSKLNSYSTTILEEDKLANILEKYNLSNDEFNVLAAIVLTEADPNSYEDSYAVINTVYNRTHSKNWVRAVNNRFGEGKGNNLYYQAILPNQFVVYQTGIYNRKLGVTDCVGYQAIIDFLYNEEIMHNYLSFRASNVAVSNYTMYSSNGNKYFNELTINNRI